MGLYVVIVIVTLLITLVNKSQDPLSRVREFGDLLLLLEALKVLVPIRVVL